jgi:predicted transcriptional regulator
MAEHARRDPGSNDVVLSMASDIVSAYLARNEAPVGTVPQIITTVFHALNQLGDSGAAPSAAKRPMPAVPIAKSVTSDYIVCLEDGTRLKMLKRHLRTVYDMSPEQYRAKWNLPPDYPMVAPGYASRRSELAKSLGLGKQRRRRIRIVK